MLSHFRPPYVTAKLTALCEASKDPHPSKQSQMFYISDKLRSECSFKFDEFRVRKLPVIEQNFVFSSLIEPYANFQVFKLSEK